MTVAMMPILISMDYSPTWIRRRLLMSSMFNLKGQMVEDALACRSTEEGLWTIVTEAARMNAINLFPKLGAGIAIPTTLSVVSVEGGRVKSNVGPVSLVSLCRPGVPLLINFGWVRPCRTRCCGRGDGRAVGRHGSCSVGVGSWCKDHRVPAPPLCAPPLPHYCRSCT